VRLLSALVALGLALAAQAGIAGWLPRVHRYVDFLLVPVVWYAIARSQRSALLTGCGAGLLQGAWFQTGPFGLHGFTKTLLGWALGGLGSRFDLNHPRGAMVGGCLFFLAERALEVGMRLLLDQAVAPLSLVELLTGAVVSGLLTAAVFTILNRRSARAGIGRGR
jgi:rod shape-determining protein MreD